MIPTEGGATLRVAGVVPAAGASRRMGRAKALLELDGRPFVAHVVRALRDGGCVPVLVVTAPGDGRTGRAAERAGAAVLENPEPGEGPITSLRLALDILGSYQGEEEVGAPRAPRRGPRPSAGEHPPDYLAVLPVDHPRVRADTVAALVESARTCRAPLVLPVYDGTRGHPALIARTLFAELADPTLRGGARTVVHRHLAEARLVDTADPGVLLDVDTPEEYEAALGAARRDPGGSR